MRKKKDIAKAMELRDSGEFQFPVYSPKWDRFRAMLRDVLDENLGYDVSRGLSYDEHERKFWIELSDGVVVGGYAGSMRCQFSFDPSGDLQTEIDRVGTEIRAWREACVSTRVAADRAETFKESGIELRDCSACKGTGKEVVK
jgi:hypothetical protein